MSGNYISNYVIGDKVRAFLGNDGITVSGTIIEVIFTADKVYYSIRLNELNTNLDKIDSALVEKVQG